MHKDNLAQWDLQSQGYYEVWYLKLNLPRGPALWLRFTTLSRADGSQTAVETWAIFFEPQDDGTATKLGAKNSFGIDAYRASADGVITMGSCHFGEGHTAGSVNNNQTAGRVEISWGLSFKSNEFTFHHVPSALTRWGLAKSTVCKPNPDIRFSGSFTVNGRTYQCEQAPGCQGHIWGTRYAERWAWAHCNSFADGSAVIEALTAQVKLGGFVSLPKLSALYVGFKGERHEFNGLRDALCLRSRYNINGWNLRATKGPLKIEATIVASQALMAGVTYESTEGTPLYCHNTALADATLSIYYKNRLEASLHSRGATSFEVVERHRLPGVEFVL